MERIRLAWISLIMNKSFFARAASSQQTVPIFKLLEQVCLIKNSFFKFGSCRGSCRVFWGDICEVESHNLESRQSNYTSRHSVALTHRGEPSPEKVGLKPKSSSQAQAQALFKLSGKNEVESSKSGQKLEPKSSNPRSNQFQFIW